MPKIAIGQFAQESHSFAPVHCSWEQFEAGHIWRRQEIAACTQDTRSELSGAIDVAKRHNIECIPLIACSAVSGGPVVQDVFEAILTEMLDRLQAELPVDGVFLALHGAMVAESADDASGAVLEAVRRLVGPDVPIAASLDLHANVTLRMVDAADILVGYHTFPHVDMYETGARAAELLTDCMADRIKPTAALRRLPMILPAENGSTVRGPYAEVMQQAIDREQQPDILSVSAFSVQPWLDLPDVGCSVLVISDGNTSLAEQEAEGLANEFWARRQQFDVPLVPLDEAITRALANERAPIIFADPADAPSSGAPGDSPLILKALLDAPITADVLVNIVDAAAVDAAIRAGVGASVSLKVGAQASPAFAAPIEITGHVRLIADGRFRFKGPGFHGVEFSRGRTVVVQSGSIYLEIMEQSVLQWDPELYRSVGLEPCDAKIVVVKSPAGFRAAYEPIAADILIVDTPGVCSPNLRSFPWQRIRRPCYPLDAMTDWHEPASNQPYESGR